MIRFLINLAIFFGSSLIGIIVADLLLDGLSVDTSSYIYVAVIFAVVQAILAPLIFKVVHSSARAFLGGVGIISTLVALIITNFVAGGMTIDGASTWILAALIVWLAGALAAFLLPFLLVKKAVQENKT